MEIEYSACRLCLWGSIASECQKSTGRYRRPAVTSWPKALSILEGSNEGLYHLGSVEIAVELIQFRQPEIVPGIVIVLWIVRIAAQITEVLHQDESAVE